MQAEVAKLQRAGGARQAELAAQARARLAAEQAELRRAQAGRGAQPRRGEGERHGAARDHDADDDDRSHDDGARPPTATTTTTTPATTTDADAAAATDGGRSGGHPEAATIALRYLGVPYVWGGATPSGFDCSGLVMYVYAQLGISLPHYAAAQYGHGDAGRRATELQPGDLVFFDGLNHVGIYIGGGQMVHAPQTGDVVKITALSDFGGGYVGARRI